VLTGGAGRDVFVFRSASELTGGGSDRIADFATADRIDLSGVDASRIRDGDQAFAFLGTGASPALRVKSASRAKPTAALPRPISTATGSPTSPLNSMAPSQ
jgi:hypothetical protein